MSAVTVNPIEDVRVRVEMNVNNLVSVNSLMDSRAMGEKNKNNRFCNAKKRFSSREKLNADRIFKEID